MNPRDDDAGHDPGQWWSETDDHEQWWSETTDRDRYWREYQDQGGGGSPCPPPEPTDWVVQGLAVDDAVLTDRALERVVGLGQRWPEPRALHQTDVFYMEDRTPLDLHLFDAGHATELLRLLVLMVDELHHAAWRDEQATQSSALRWLLDGLDVPPIAAHDPVVWLESTVLVRWLRSRTRS